MEKIAEALKSTSTKIENLRKSFDSVKLHSSSLTSFTLQWTDLEQHFDSLQKSLEQRFKQLETKEKQQQQPESSVVRSELKSFCVKMDGLGLRSFVMDSPKDLPITREDVTFALQSAPDPAKLVVDALQRFYPLKSKRERDRGGKFGAIRRTCALLLEGLADIGPEINAQVKGDAKRLAIDWKCRVSTHSDDQLETLVFLQLLGTYGLAAEFDVNEILDLLVSIARRKQAVDLFRGLGFQDKISDFVQKLSTKGKQIDAVKFAYAFEVVDKFPPVPLLKAYLEESKKVAQEVRKKGKDSARSQNEAIAKETAYLQAIIKCIEEYKLESQYSREAIDMRIKELEKQKPEKKRPATVTAPFPASNPQQNQQMQSENKRLRWTSSNNADIAIHTSHLQPTGLLREQVSPFLSSSTQQYGLSATTSTFSSYMNAAAGPSGTDLASQNVGTNQKSSFSHLHPLESNMPSSLYDRSRDLGGYGLLPLYKSSLFYS